MKILGVLFLILCEEFYTVSSSAGDRSLFYQTCLRDCLKANCSDGGKSFSATTKIEQDIGSKLLMWSCSDECRYSCMWYTVHQYDDYGGETLKFYGKWPFIRFLGIQEPASTLSSLLNLATNLYMYLKLRREFSMEHMPLVLFWHAFAYVCMNAWVWSAIFHMRDTPFTEFMDYACALSMVMGLFISAIVRTCYKNRRLTILLCAVPLCYYVTHVQYLYDGRIDYGYNMKVNVVVGAGGGALWLAVWRRQAARGGRHAGRLPLFVAASGAALALELLDFPPLWSCWDAHALWHLATAPLPLLFFKYVIDDLRYLQAGHYEKFGLKLT